MSKLPAPLNRLPLPIIGAPLFIISNPKLVVAQCSAGVVGSMPALNARPAAQLEDWLAEITETLAAWDRNHPDRPAAPFAVNQIVHTSNARLDADFDVLEEHKVPLVITSLRAPTEYVPRIHAWGGHVFHDVTSIRHAEKALEAGVDGLILVCAGAGGHSGALSPMALTSEVRRIYDGLVVLAGSITRGEHVLAALAMGADMAYMGTRFIATEEARAIDAYMTSPSLTPIQQRFLRRTADLLEQWEMAALDLRDGTHRPRLSLTLTPSAAARPPAATEPQQTTARGAAPPSAGQPPSAPRSSTGWPRISRRSARASSRPRHVSMPRAASGPATTSR